MPAPTIIFDLDGTLVDTAPDLIATLNWLLLKEGLDPVDYDNARKFIGGGAKRMIEQGFISAGRTFATPDIDRLYSEFVARYADRIAEKSRPFPGLEYALDTLSNTGSRLAVCTNKLEWLSVRLLEVLGLRNRFVTICGQDTFGVQKPNPEILRRTIQAAGGKLETSLMIGDSETDILTARGAGIPVIAVDFGYSAMPVSTFSPDNIISHFDLLPGAVLEVFPWLTEC